MKTDLITKRTEKLSSFDWARMVTDLDKVNVDAKLLFSISDEDLITLHRAYFPIPFEFN